MLEWKTFATNPPALFDVLARYYDAGLNRFLIQRFSNCFVQDMAVLWPSPFRGEPHAVDLQANGYRPIRWAETPDLPDDLKEIPGGPKDHA